MSASYDFDWAAYWKSMDPEELFAREEIAERHYRETAEWNQFALELVDRVKRAVRERKQATNKERSHICQK